MRFFSVLLLAGLAMAQGGPDDGGYRWLDSDTGAGPEFSWLDISSTGTVVPLGDDDNAGPFALGFTVDFYGEEFDSVRVCSNGWLSFVSASHQFHHYSIPEPRDPNALLAVLWADLDPSAGGEVRFLADTAEGRFIVSWLDVPFYRGDSCTLQAIIDSAGEVVYQFLDLPDGLCDGTDSCSVGIEDAEGLAGLEYLHDAEPGENLLHDSLAIRFLRLQHDVYPELIGRPFAEELAGTSVEPVVGVHNVGRATEDFVLTVRTEGYDETAQVSGLASLDRELVTLPPVSFGSDTYDIVAFTTLAGDEDPGNDTLRMRVIASPEGELRYDDGTPDTAMVRIGSPNADWAALVRFRTPFSATRLVGMRVFTQDTLPFARVLVCPGDSSGPDLDMPFFESDTVHAAAPDTWLALDADTLIQGEQDLWMVAFWPRGAQGPAVGDDRTAPTDGFSWFGSPTVAWIPHRDGDLMMRLRVRGDVGIEELEPVRVPGVTVAPNPARGANAAVRVQGVRGGRVRVTVRDVSGRVVRDMTLPVRGGAAVLDWDRTDLSGRAVPAGAYYVEVRTCALTSCHKLLLVD